MAFTIKEVISQLRNRLTSVHEVYEQCLLRCKQTSTLNIHTAMNCEKRLAKHLRQSQENYDHGKAGPLEGIPITFKDNFCTQDLPTTCTSLMLKDFNPPYDATMVSRTVDSGAVLMGKTNMDEFAMGSGSIDSLMGAVKNPWNLVQVDDNKSLGVDKEWGNWVIAGGSSGGSAASVAAGASFVSFGSDTGGSVRLPASYCGVVGMKPTYGLLSRHGLIPLCNSLDCPAIVTQTVEDAAIVLNVVAGHDLRDSTSVLESHIPFVIDPGLDFTHLHIGIPKEFHHSMVDADVIDIWTKMADSFEKAGAKVSQVSLPHFKYHQKCYAVLTACDVASNFARYDGVQFGLREGNEESTEELYAQTRHLGFNEVVRGRIMAGNYFLLKRNYEHYFVKAMKIRRLITEDFKKLFDTGVNFLLGPTAHSDAPDFNWFSEDTNHARCELLDAHCSGANLAGLPAISIPAGLSKRGLPIGLQLIGPQFSESNLLSVSHWMEKEADSPRLFLDHLDVKLKHPAL